MVCGMVVCGVIAISLLMVLPLAFALAFDFLQIIPVLVLAPLDEEEDAGCAFSSFILAVIYAFARVAVLGSATILLTSSHMCFGIRSFPITYTFGLKFLYIHSSYLPRR